MSEHAPAYAKPAPVPTPEGVEIIKRETVFRGWFQIDRLTLRHTLFKGGWTPPFTREVFERGHAAAVLLYDPARDTLALTEQFRVGALAAQRHPWLIEVVAGIIDAGETAEQCAIRESREEAGVEVTELVPIVSATASPGGSTETVTMFCARIDSSKIGGVFGMQEESEDIRVFAVPFEEAMRWTGSGRISNSTTLVSLFWLALHRDELRKKWGAG